MNLVHYFFQNSFSPSTFGFTSEEIFGTDEIPTLLENYESTIEAIVPASPSFGLARSSNDARALPPGIDFTDFVDSNGNVDIQALG